MRSFQLFTFFFFIGMLGFANAGWAATLSGNVRFEGKAPEAQRLDMASDPTCAAIHSGGVASEEVVVNPNGTLKNVFIYVKEGLAEQVFDPPKDPVILDQKGCRYIPHVFGIQTGQPIQIVNSDATLHNVHSVVTQNKGFNLGMPIQGMKLTKKFDKPEIMAKFKCDVHPWMAAYAGVLRHPFFSVTNDEGSFEIKNLPVGNYVVETWHEKYGLQSHKVSIDSAEENKVIELRYSA